jgi:hypothetical protein
MPRARGPSAVHPGSPPCPGHAPIPHLARAVSAGHVWISHGNRGREASLRTAHPPPALPAAGLVR